MKKAVASNLLPRMVVYKVTYPNGKIYVGHDRTDSIAYFGSPDNAIVAADFPVEARMSLTLTKDIIAVFNDRKERQAAEMRLIRELRSNDPAIGYNRNPKWSGIS